ncbi:hypothetical protein [Pseudonocardia zijingensis]|uniref:Uncharacterized protein n=1 Tax=Pseudonocardia zijingensis TaxID=153376 RepID=A0ABN1NLF1_9PSEU
MPESRKRKPKKKSTPLRSLPPVSVPGRYSAGTLKLSDERVGGLLSPDVPPDLLIEALPAALWLNVMSGQRANVCVDGSMILHFAYQQLGIVAEPRAVDLVIHDARTDRRVFYGRPDPWWDGTTFHGHCILWLPGSRRLIDATVEQYPEVRKYRLGPIIGRSVVARGTEEQREAVARGELVPGSHIGVKREALMLLYTTVSEQFKDVVADGPLVQETRELYRRAGVNLASTALQYFRHPEIVERVKLAPYPRVHKLIEAIGGAKVQVDKSGDMWFKLKNGDGEDLQLRLDDVPVPDDDPRVPEDVADIMADVETAVRAVLAGSRHVKGSTFPTLLFEPQRGVMVQRQSDWAPSEAQAEAIIRAGFTRYLPIQDIPVHHLAHWYLKYNGSMVELWEGDGIWARGRLSLTPEWIDAAEAAGRVQVIYGVKIGVGSPVGASFSEDDRQEMLQLGRAAGIVASATVPWRRPAPRAQGGWLKRLGIGRGK